jgi:hypothetical protein
LLHHFVITGNKKYPFIARDMAALFLIITLTHRRRRRYHHHHHAVSLTTGP